MLVEELRRNPWLLVEEASRPKTISSEPVNVPAPF